MTVAHGTRLPAGNEVARSITAVAGARLGMPGVAAFVELASPLLSSVLSSSEPAVVVPLLLSTGHHVREDLAAVPGRALGPDALLAQAQLGRLVSAGARPGSALVMVAAGSRDPLAGRDLALARDLLADAWGGPVRLATLGGHGDRPADVVRPGDAVSPYLLAPGYFATRCRAESLTAGASVVADVLGPHPSIVDLVVDRAQEQLAARRSA